MIKPILFSTSMVQAILRGDKTVTRRLISPQHLRVLESPYRRENPDVEDATLLAKLCLPPYSVGDTLYVREAWALAYDVAGFPGSVSMAGAPQYVYRADGPDGLKWRPSIHMPKAAARMWLRVTAVQPARLHDMEEADVRREGFVNPGDFIRAWDATLRPESRASAGWCANPWVWVISFERLTEDETRELVLT